HWQWFGRIVSTYWLVGFIHSRKKKKRNSTEREVFQRNGTGLLLQQQLSSNQVNVEKTKLFNSEELEMATDHFNVNRIFGQRGQGTVYRVIFVW
ncbi:hypothetical protein PanWU01x14_301360, partial [Parasponia andersonii]